MATGAYRILIELPNTQIKRIRAPLFIQQLISIVSNLHKQKLKYLEIIDHQGEKFNINTQQQYQQAKQSTGFKGIKVSIPSKRQPPKRSPGKSKLRNKSPSFSPRNQQSPAKKFKPNSSFDSTDLTSSLFNFSLTTPQKDQNLEFYPPILKNSNSEYLIKKQRGKILIQKYPSKEVSSTVQSSFIQLSSRMLLRKDTLYITGGVSNSQQTLMIDLLSSTISYLADLQQGRLWHTMVLIQNKPAVIGGCSPGYPKKALISVETLEQSWNSFPSLLTARCNPAACNLKEEVYVFGGMMYLQGISLLQKSIQKWNGHQWEYLSMELPSPVQGMGCIPFNGSSVLMFGGKDQRDEDVDSVWLIDVVRKKMNRFPILNTPNRFTDHLYLCRDSKLVYLNPDEVVVYSLLNK